MIKKYSTTVVCITIFFFFFNLQAQNSTSFSVDNIDPALKKNANAVVRLESVNVQINAVNSVTVTTKRAVTVLNKYGNKRADFYEPYNPETKIKKVHATVYNANGTQIKEYKKKDFHDRSATDGFSLIGDGRYVYYDYTPNEYPYTIYYESEVVSENTAFLNSWFPILGYNLSLEESYFKVVNVSNIELRTFESNFDQYPIKIEKQNQEVLYSLSNIPALKYEILGPSYFELLPNAKLALNNFSLVNVKGSAKDWQTMGAWQYENLVSNRDQLPEETISEVSELVKNESTLKEKSKLIYEYVQSKTRYVSVQLGIGSWMPMKAQDVDRLGYGDCKALTNYTKALLSTQGIEANYCVVYADDRRDINSEFASMQGNHVILNIPNENEDIWLECTNQSSPFNYIGEFTDNREVLVVKPQGGEIKRTKKYETDENLLETNAEIKLDPDLSMKTTLERSSIGLQYDWQYKIQFLDPKDQHKKYKEEWSYINNLKIEESKFTNDKDYIVFKETIELSSTSYLKKVGDRLILIPNVFQRTTDILPVYKNRKTALVIERGYVNLDQYAVTLPSGYIINNLPENKYIKNQFGEYSYELEKLSDTKIKFKRFLKITDGKYPKESYEEYRKFKEEIRKIDQTKILLYQS